jgi:hypothetical protein
MNEVEQFFSGVPLQFWPACLFFSQTVLTLLFSMIVTSQMAGGIDFGHISYIAPRALVLLLLVNAINLVDCGVLLAGPVWFLGLMFLFQLDFRETRMLTRINWGMNLVWKLLLFLAFS